MNLQPRAMMHFSNKFNKILFVKGTLHISLVLINPHSDYFSLAETEHNSGKHSNSYFSHNDHRWGTPLIRWSDFLLHQHLWVFPQFVFQISVTSCRRNLILDTNIQGA